MMITSRQLASTLLALAAAATLFALSFVATPVKFLAENVALHDLLSIGRVTFRASLAVEVCFLLPLLFLARGNLRWLPFIIAVLLTAQWLMLMPLLDARTQAAIAGDILPPSSLHTWWIAADVARLALYLAIVAYFYRLIGVASKRQPGRSEPGSY